MAKKQGKAKKKGKTGKKKVVSTEVPEPESLPLLYKHASFDILPKGFGSNSFRFNSRIRNDKIVMQIMPNYASFLKHKNFHLADEVIPATCLLKKKAKKATSKKKKGKSKK